MSVDIDNVTVNKCYKLESTDAYLGKLVDEPVIKGSGDSREMYASFLNKTTTTDIPRWANFSFDNSSKNKKNKFILVDCEMEGGRRKSRRRTKKGRRSRRHL